MARIVVCSLLEGAFVIAAALVMATDDSTVATHHANASLAGQTTTADASRIMVWWTSLPALCVALVALAIFLR
jgi:hypothetical protein